MTALPLLACVEGTSVEIGGTVSFNDTLREDLEPLTLEDENDERRYFRSGEAGGLIDTLVPTGMPESHLEKLRRSHTLWSSGNLDLSYQLVFIDPLWNGEKPTLSYHRDKGEDSKQPATLVGWHPRDGMTDPVTRQLVMFEGNLIASPFRPEVTQFTVALERCEAGAAVDDPNQPARRLDQQCDLEELNFELCDPKAVIAPSTYAPYTIMRCNIAADVDTSYALHAVDFQTFRNMAESFPRVDHEPHAIEPTIRSVRWVDGARTLARPLQFHSEGCLIESLERPEPRPCVGEDEDPGDGVKFLRSHWSWQVGEDEESGLWDENFSSRLQVTRAFLFVQDPRVRGLTGRRYLSPDNIEELKIGTDDLDCNAQADPETGRAVFDLTACERKLVVTPTYDHALLSGAHVDERLLWQPFFRVAAIGDTFHEDLPVNRADALFIEFEVDQVGRVRSDRALTLSPALLDFGDVKRGSKNTVERGIQISNRGSYGEIIEEVRIDGSSDFSVTPSDGHTFPFVLRSGEEIDLTLSVAAQGSGSHDARLVVRTTQSGQTVERAAILQSFTVFADGNVRPDIVGLEAPRGRGLDNPLPRIRRLLVESLGHADLPVYSVSLVGRDAAHFTVVESFDKDRSLDIHALPYPAPTKIAPGDADLLAVVYHPSQSTAGGDFHRAQVIVEHEAGTHVVNLLGTCDHAPGDCAYSGLPNAP